MASFKDAEGKAWEFKINYASVQRVRTAVQVDLLDIGEALFAKLADPIALIDTLYVLCKPHADEIAITDEQFAARLSGDSVDAGLDAIIQGICDFFPSRSRDLLRKMKTKIDALSEKAAARVHSILDGDELDQALGLSKSTSKNCPAISESSLSHTASESSSGSGSSKPEPSGTIQPGS